MRKRAAIVWVLSLLVCFTSTTICAAEQLQLLPIDVACIEYNYAPFPDYTSNILPELLIDSQEPVGLNLTFSTIDLLYDLSGIDHSRLLSAEMSGVMLPVDTTDVGPRTIATFIGGNAGPVIDPAGFSNETTEIGSLSYQPPSNAFAVFNYDAADGLRRMLREDWQYQIASFGPYTVGASSIIGNPAGIALAVEMVPESWGNIAPQISTETGLSFHIEDHGDVTDTGSQLFEGDDIDVDVHHWYDRRIYISIENQIGSDWWSIDLERTNRERFEVGTYTFGHNWPNVDDDDIELDFSGPGGFPNPTKGELDVIAIEFNEYNSITELAFNLELVDIETGQASYSKFRYNYTPPCTEQIMQADFNCDGSVGLLDLDILGRNWRQEVEPYTDGDATGDSYVSLLDLDILGRNWRQTIPIPEPASAILIALTLPTVLARRR